MPRKLKRGKKYTVTEAEMKKLAGSLSEFIWMARRYVPVGATYRYNKAYDYFCEFFGNDFCFDNEFRQSQESLQNQIDLASNETRSLNCLNELEEELKKEGYDYDEIRIKLTQVLVENGYPANLPEGAKKLTDLDLYKRLDHPYQVGGELSYYDTARPEEVERALKNIIFPNGRWWQAPREYIPLTLRVWVLKDILANVDKHFNFDYVKNESKKDTLARIFKQLEKLLCI